MASKEDRQVALNTAKAAWRSVCENLRDNFLDGMSAQDIKDLIKTVQNPCNQVLCDIYHGAGNNVDPNHCKTACDVYADCQDPNSVRQRLHAALIRARRSGNGGEVRSIASEFISRCDAAVLKEDR